jgi:hypothetical protein
MLLQVGVVVVQLVEARNAEERGIALFFAAVAPDGGVFVADGAPREFFVTCG